MRYLIHMHGNVYEYCLDWYDSNFYTELDGDGTSPDINPVNDTQDTATSKVVRGGSWGNTAYNCRTAYRVGTNNVNEYIGFRLARPVP